MARLLRTKATGVWLVLAAATTLSWLVGVEGKSGHDGHQLASGGVLAIAFFKARLVGLYFMELSNAPILLRAAFEGYCAVVCAVLISLLIVL